MTSSKSTKRALISSALAILMCVAMLIGTTFAWFTDTASTGVNKIVSGNLDVVLEMNIGGEWVDANGKTLPFLVAGEIPAEGTEILWEPGCTYRVPELRIRNNGNLSLQAYVYVSGFKASGESDVDLRDVIDWKMSTFDGMLTHPNKDISVIVNPGQSLKFDLEAHMKEEAGNEYQGLSVEGISITVVAKQHTYEKDSFDDQYDKDATYPVASAAEMKEALANGGIVSVNKDIKTDNIVDNEAARITISKPTTLNLDAKIISPDDMGNNSTNFCALIVDADTTINAGENGGIDTGRNGGYALNVRKGANLTITGGSYYGGGTAVQVQEGTLTITGGHFAVEAFGEPYGYNFLLNCIDSAYRNGSAKIIVTGGTFVNFNPADNAAEGANTNFVAAGYKAVPATQANADVWYTVVAELGTIPA